MSELLNITLVGLVDGRVQQGYEGYHSEIVEMVLSCSVGCAAVATVMGCRVLKVTGSNESVIARLITC